MAALHKCTIKKQGPGGIAGIPTNKYQAKPVALCWSQMPEIPNLGTRHQGPRDLRTHMYTLLPVIATGQQFFYTQVIHASTKPPLLLQEVEGAPGLQAWLRLQSKTFYQSFYLTFITHCHRLDTWQTTCLPNNVPANLSDGRAGKQRARCAHNPPTHPSGPAPL